VARLARDRLVRPVIEFAAQQPRFALRLAGYKTADNNIYLLHVCVALHLVAVHAFSLEENILGRFDQALEPDRPERDRAERRRGGLANELADLCDVPGVRRGRGRRPKELQDVELQFPGVATLTVSIESNGKEVAGFSVRFMAFGTAHGQCDVADLLGAGVTWRA